MPEEAKNLLIFRIFAARAAAELARLHLEKSLAESEQRFRDLYEEAPIAYVKEDLESRFISANRAANFKDYSRTFPSHDIRQSSDSLTAAYL